ncbi:MAG: hypothetical protein J5747_05190 [Spirochaetaceae bacterium]|nr:hypothetical protein [Spirochaetaceae bacterium]
MSITIKLAKLYLSQLLSFSSIKDGFTQGGKKALKSVGLILLFLYCVSVFGFLYVSIANILYSSTAQIGMSHLFPLMLGFVILVITFVFGFLTTLGTYSSAQNEEILLSMPLTDKQFFLAKFISTYICELPVSFALIVIGVVIYGKNEGLLTNPLLYLSVLVNTIVIPLIILAVCYVLVILILNIFSFLKNKTLLIGISTACLLIAILALNFSYQNLMMSAATNGISQEMLTSVTNTISSVAKILMPIQWFAESFTNINTSVGSVLLKLLFLTAIGAVFLFMLLPLLSSLYKKTVIGFNEISAKRISKDKIDTFIQHDIKSTPLLKAVFVRDVKSLFREPTWLTNGPLIIFLMPLIIFFSMYVSIKSNGSLEGFKGAIEGFRAQIIMYMATSEASKNTILYAAAGITSICAIFSGCNTFVAASAISREGKGLSNLMALPVSWKTILTAKMIHAMIYCVLTTILGVAVMTAVIVYLDVPLAAKDIVLTYVATIILSIVFSFIIQILNMLFDVVNPKLSWENPSAAMKRNTNTLLAMLITIGTVALLIAAGVLLLPMRIETILVVSAVLTVVAILLWKWFLNYAPKALRRRF